MVDRIGLFSFFSGAGFLDLGFELCDAYSILFVNEINQHFMEAYKYSRKQMGIQEPKLGYESSDIQILCQGEKLTEIKHLISVARQEFEVIGFIGGPPCPDFSVGGKNRGKDGENGKLSASYIDLICKTSPDFFLFENVKGLWKTKKHREFYEGLKKKLVHAGYVLTDRIINAIEYGAPQDRERLILFGASSSLLSKKKILIPKNSENYSLLDWEKHKKHLLSEISSISWPSESEFRENSLIEMPENIKRELTVAYWFEKNQVEQHPNSVHFFKPRAGIHRFKSVAEGDSSRKSFKRLHRWRYSPTAAYGNNEVHLHPYKPRRITVAEALAIQSLPRDFLLPDTMTLSHMFKTVGNGVPFLAALGLAKTISDFVADIDQAGNTKSVKDTRCLPQFFKMNKLTASNLVRFISQLPKNVTYNYVNKRNKGLIRITSIDYPEGPIRIRRWNPSAKELSKRTESEAKEESISTQMLWRLANALEPGLPVNVDRLFGASYNTRSVLEALLAHTPEFYYCYPGRIEIIASSTAIQAGHKHLMWCPGNPHELGKLEQTESDIVISEIPSSSTVYEALVLPESVDQEELDIEVKRRHAQMQIALFMIGKQLGYRTWIAQNDKGIVYQDKKLGEYEGIIVSLSNEQLLSAYEEAARAALLIDCIWFKNGRLMPAVMEVEHSTGVTSGLTRMKNFQDKFPPFPTRYVVVAADEDREKVFREANKEQFRALDTRFFPYSAVEELYSLCQRRKLTGITEEFLDCFMETTLDRGDRRSALLN